MAMQEASPATVPSAQVVGNAFIEQYYHILHQSPNLVHRFYQNSSFLSRPDSNGSMTTVTGMEAINEKILSLNYEDYTAEIKTADSQDSFEKGVIVLVTGCLTGKDDVRRKFTQTFFLAPQDKGYYVLNDVFRFVEENDTMQINSLSVNTISEDAAVAAATEPEVIHAPDQLAVESEISVEGEDLNHGDEVIDPLENEEEGSVIKEEVVEPTSHLSQNEIITGDSAPAIQDDAPKKSYASIVMKGITASGPVYVPTHSTRVAATKTNQKLAGPAKLTSASEVQAPSSDNAPESSNVHEEAEGHSIYIRNLPYDATVEQLEAVFMNFGPIKHDGIQVRSSKQGFCFGFVEFEALSSMQNAIKSSPITIGDRQSVVEEKRTTTRVSGSGRGRYPSGRVGFQNESFRGSGKFGGGRGYGRNEFRNQGEFSRRPRGSAGHSGEGSQQDSQKGGGGGEGVKAE
ncbi:ras GTPase-activating protein-binding protein 2 [Quillaja saponaria]|uniref:Ras GTPase-activating protein-binding protein 2 n=1 Tax=Quillaja saponaria TaxID=32244 RepID=A0AAD7LE57_QUISA|nr:ras GTPase-activating protein-binding protein 2 [Quillaja saponaria]